MELQQQHHHRVINGAATIQMLTAGVLTRVQEVLIYFDAAGEKLSCLEELQACVPVLQKISEVSAKMMDVLNGSSAERSSS